MAYSGGVGPEISPAVAPVAGTRIYLRRTDTQGKKPQVADAEYGELFVNYHSSDPMLCFKDNADNIVEIKPVSQVGSGGPPPGSGNNTGDLWWDGTHLLVWNGSSWEVIGEQALGDLTDVDTTGEADGMVLSYNGSEWVPVNPASLAVDVDLGYTPAADKGTVTNTAGDDAEIPLANGTSAGLTLNNYTTAEKDKLDGIEDGAEANVVTSVHGRTGDVVAAEGDYSLDQMSDVDTTGASDGKLLKYQGGSWVAGSPAAVSVDLGYTPAADKGTVTNDAGTDAEIPLVNDTNAGLMSPDDFKKLGEMPGFIVGGTEPGSPAAGDIWVDTSACPPAINIWDDCDDPGNPTWKPIGGGDAGGGCQQGPVSIVSSNGTELGSTLTAQGGGGLDAGVLLDPPTYTWTGPNGFTATGQSVVATEEGDYTVTAKVICSDTTPLEESATWTIIDSYVDMANNTPPVIAVMGGSPDTAYKGSSLIVLTDATVNNGENPAIQEIQWFADGAAAGTGLIYTAKADDEGKTITAKQLFRDDRGNELLSDASNGIVIQVCLLTVGKGSISPSAGAEVGEQLTGTASVSGAIGTQVITHTWEVNGEVLDTGSSIYVTTKGGDYRYRKTVADDYCQHTGEWSDVVTVEFPEPEASEFVWDASNDSYTRVPVAERSIWVQAKMRRCLLGDSGTVSYYLDADDSTQYAADWLRLVETSELSANYNGTHGAEVANLDLRERATDWVAGTYNKGDMVIHNGSVWECIVNTTASTPNQLGGGVAKLDGSRGQVMVEIPMFSIKHETVDVSSYKQHKFFTQLGEHTTDGFEVHPAFIKPDGSLRDFIYISAYQSTGPNGNGCISGALNSTNYTRAACRTACAGRGAGWHSLGFWDNDALRWLYTSEYQDMNSQKVLGNGAIEGAVYQVNTGLSNARGNRCENAYTSGGAATDYMSYRGIENFYGRAWQWVDGININERNVYLSNNPANWADDTATNYSAAGVVPTGSGDYQRDLMGGTALLPSSVTGASETTYIGDALWTGAGWRVARVGGRAGNGGRVGAFCLLLSGDSSFANPYDGSRLCYGA